MYRFWNPVIGPLLDLVDPDVVVEIGSDQALNTRNLVDFCTRRECLLHVIDPLPKYDVDEWLQQYSPHLVFHRTTSVEALGSIEEPDVVLIDGDHNWHTVINELRLLEQTAGDGGFPLVFLHDVGWPYGRRDLYYEPDRIPSPDRQPHRQQGMRPGRRDLDPEGGLNAHLFNAVTEGGPRNGVLTAVEDFMAETEYQLEFAVVPGINSLGILYPADLAQRNPEAVAQIEGLVSPSALLQMLEKVESMRVESQIEALDVQRARDGYRKDLAEERARLADLKERHTAAEKKLARLVGEHQLAVHQRDQAKTDNSRLQSEVETLRRRIDEERAEAKKSAEKDLEAERRRHVTTRKELASAQKKLASTQRSYERLRSRRTVRLALKLASLARPLIRVVRRARKAGQKKSGETALTEPRSTPGRVLGPRDQARLARAIVAERPGSGATEGTMVSIVVLTRDGADHLARLLPRLDDTTRYRSFELIVVDNGSTDGTAQLLEVERGYPVKVIANEANTSFSAGNNQGVAIASGDLILFMNNDIEPINPGWLGSMVEVMTSGENVVATGAELVYPVRGISGTDLTVQHTGIEFAFRAGAIHAVNRGATDPLDPRLAGVREVPAATAAALMVDKETFRQVGGFDEGYVYGTEDVDLCLKLREHGAIVVTGDSVLFHHESATQSLVESEITYVNRSGNWRLFAETWAPRLARSVRRERLTGAHRYAREDERTVAITLTHDDPTAGWGDYYTAHELGDAFASAGWKVVYAERYGDNWYELDDDVDLVISLLEHFDVTRAPDGAYTVAWVRNWVDRWLEQPWFDTYDLVVASGETGAQFIADRSRFSPPSIPLATNPDRFHPGPPHPSFTSDYAFTGNNWGRGRGVVPLLDVHPEERFHVFGKGWGEEARVARYWKGTLDYELVPEVYRSTKIVLDDTGVHALPYGFVNSRVFDALASGALVLSNNPVGSQEIFGGKLPAYGDRAELRELLDRYLDNDEERVELAHSLREEVLAHHTYSRRPEEFVREVLTDVDRPHAAIKIGVPNEEAKPSWGDTHFANGLASALTRLGMPTRVDILPEWDLPERQAVDVVIHIRGLTTYAPKPAHVNVLWLLSHPDDVTPRECEKYDLVLVASRLHADLLKEQVSKPVVFMPQATDERRFKPMTPDPDLATDVLFLGNSRGQRRPAVDWAIESGLPLTVYGSKWEGRIPSSYVRAELFPNENLASLYASAKVTLNDHWPDMRDRGFISNRIFDALAAGGVVVSDPVAGLEEIFGDLVPTFSNAAELDALVRDLLEDSERREKISHEGSLLVARDHTFSHRGAEIMSLLRPHLEGRTMDLEGNRFELAPSDQV